GLLAGGLAVLPAAAQISAEQTIKSLKVAPGLEVTLWASEPQLFKPTNMDIDARGRIWLTEGVNYRSVHPRADGDRIIILEDSQHTGKCDNYKVFVQDTKLKAPLGICVLGNKVIVAQSPNMLIYTMDASGDRPVGPPQVIFTGFGGVDHDHGVHTGVFGPDGRYYFNCGNEGNHSDLIKYGDYVKGKEGQPVVDITGSQLGRKATQFRGHPRQQGETGYREGLALSMNPDGSDLEVLGYNFRNNYELAIDSFGTVWQSDNDDDGNQSVAINYVMEGGNFGFTGPTGANWGRDMQQYANIFKGQTKQESHWHQRWPGVVPNLLNTGAGSPCGMIVYEGDLLPEPYRGTLLHCDAGPNVVRAYITKFGTLRPAGIAKPVGVDEAEAWQKEGGKGGGYEAKEVEVIKASDRWFRPDDICVAPDGAVYISDWYDPGVGGHHTGDTGVNIRDTGWQTLHGRIYRLAPPGYMPSVPALDLDSVAGQVAALNSPNLARRYLGYAKLAEQLKTSSSNVISALADQFANNKNARLRARALWLLAISGQGQKNVQDALKDQDVNIRITGIRAARHIKMDSVAVANQMIGDAAMPVLRELCLAMQFEPTEKAMPVLLKLAEKYDGQDRWYLEAFGIGCIGREKEVLAAYQKAHPADDAQSKNIAWRLKMEPVQPSDAGQASATPVDQTLSNWWGVGPFAVEGGAAALDSQLGPEKSAASIDMKTSFTGLDNKSVHWEKVASAGGRGRGGRTLSISQFATQHGFRADNVVGYFATAITSEVDRQVDLTLQSADACKIWLNGAPVTAKSSADGSEIAAKLDLRKGKNVLMLKVSHQTGRGTVNASIYAPSAVVVTDDVVDATATAAVAAPAPITPTAPEKQFKTKDGQILPSMGDLAKLTGDTKAGEKVFRNTTGANCIKCHQIGDEGQMIGPPLTVVGSKLSKPQLYEAILYPSLAIEMGYETWVVRTKGGDVISGLKVEDTPDHITIKDTDAKFHDIAVDQVDKMVKQPISLMPEGLNETMTKQDLVDLVEYLSARKS
ncbi:MAG TPA: PVC-type heme-binding CxxCH protein, partial [Humisphaera sp.]|nr:PVC-type heme-binding CxxCH protein [Humisphaera sp.]